MMQSRSGNSRGISCSNILKQILKIIFANSRDEIHPKPTQLQAASVGKLVMPSILYLSTN